MIDKQFREILNFIKNEFLDRDKYLKLDIEKLKIICEKIKENEICDPKDLCKKIVREK